MSSQPGPTMVSAWLHHVITNRLRRLGMPEDTLRSPAAPRGARAPDPIDTQLNRYFPFVFNG
jgi:hypothetical protein